MRKLAKTYWNKFLTVNTKGNLIRDGILFEDLVEELLKLEYPSTWKRTKKSHDFNRDFHLTTQDQKVWAECKNYEDDISLDTIAPTLVMAQIFTVNQIVFFSYSTINSSARRKIYAFASRTNKNIYIVDEALLDTLIIKQADKLPVRFRPSKSDIIDSESKRECQLDFYFIQTPIIGATLEDRQITAISDVKKINYNSVFEILIFCEPNSLNGQYRLVISTETADIDINNNYEILDTQTSDLGSLCITKNFVAASGCMQRILLKPRFFKASLNLPVIKAQVYDASQLVVTKKSPYRQVQNEWVGQTVLVGQHYRELVLKLEQKVLNNDNISCFVVYGNSGTGKTRILKESLEILLKHNYKIASFIGNERDSSRTILKEIIYFIYEVPRKEIFQYLENHISGDIEITEQNGTALKAYNLAKKIGQNLSDAELMEFIDNYFDILYEKLSNEPIAIVIDNLQFFNTPLIYFLQRYLDYAKHQTRKNRSVLILSINQDYANSDIQNFLNYIQELEKDRPTFLSKEISGFLNIKQAVVFLRELLNIKNEYSDVQLEMLAKKASLIPYHIHQAIYSLLDDNIIQYSSDNKGFIANMSKFYRAVEIMPDTIYKILKKRWLFLIDKNNLEEKDCKIICSLISILGTIRNEHIEAFHLNEHCIHTFVKHTFLKEDDEGNITFDHDIIEGFLLKHYNQRYYEIFNYIKEHGLTDELELYPFLNNFYKIKKTNVSIDTLKHIVNFSCAHQPPYKMVDPFFRQLIKVLLCKCEKFSNYEEWLNTISMSCNALRNITGFRNTLPFYQMVNTRIDEIGMDKFLDYPGFRNYINSYTDILHHLQQSEDAIQFLNNVLERLTNEKDNDCFFALKSMVYNRLMINHREHETPNHILERDNCLAKSINYARKIKDPNLRDEFTYLNLSDEGYIYYALGANRDKLLSVWEQCKEYPPQRLPQKTLNYYRKMVQLNLIYGNIEETDLYVEKIQAYIERKTYTSERIVFSLFALTAKTMCLLLDSPTEQYSAITQNISNLMHLSKLKGGNKEYNILNLKAITAYYNGDYAGMITSFNEAYRILKHIKTTMHLQDQIELITDNILFACFQKSCMEDLKEILYDKSPAWIQEQDEFYLRDGYCAKGILRTADGKFNLPLVV